MDISHFTDEAGLFDCCGDWLIRPLLLGSEAFLAIGVIET